jgi:DNA-binding NarL/FixJ family response regulator
MRNIRILLAEDHHLVRTAFVSLLQKEPGIFVVGEASDGLELIKKYETLLPDLVIADISMPALSGTQAVRKLKADYPDIKALFLSVFSGEPYIYSVLKAGGLGLIGKDSEPGELLYAINEVMHGKKYFGSICDENKLDEIIKMYEPQPAWTNFTHELQVNKTEEKILFLISEGLSSIEIGEKLFLSKKSIDNYRSKIMHRFEIKNQATLIKFAILYTELKNNNIDTTLLSIISTGYGKSKFGIA